MIAPPRWRRALTHLQIEYVIIGIGAVYQLLLRYFTFSIDFDHSILLISGVNVLRGGSFGVLKAGLNDLAAITDGRVTHWPPGFSVLTMAVVAMTEDPFVSIVAIDLLGMVVYFTACAALISRLWNVLPQVSRLLFAFVAAVAGPLYIDFFANPWTLGMFLWAVVLLLPSADGRPPALWACFSAGVLLGLTVSLRYAYGPLSGMPVLAMAIAGYRTPEGRRRAIIALLGWLCGVAPFLWWKLIYIRNREVAHLEFEGQMFLRNLLRFHPFGGDAIFGNRLTKDFPLSAYRMKTEVATWQLILRHLGSNLALAAAAVGLREAAKRAPTQEDRRIVTMFALIGVLCLGVNVVFLTALSLFHAPNPSLWGWIFVEEPRYYAANLPFVLVGVAYMAWISSGPAFLRVLRVLSLTAFFLSAVLWTADLPKEWTKVRESKVGGPIERLFMGEGFLNRILREHPVDVYIELGKFTHGVILRGFYSTFEGVPSNTIVEAGTYRPKTSAPVNVLFLADTVSGTEYTDALTALCKRLGGGEEARRKLRLCRVRLMPAEPAK